MHPLIVGGHLAGARTARPRRRAACGQDRRRDERGFVLVFALLIMAAAIVVMVGISAGAFHVNRQSVRESSADRASAAADAGVQVALFRLNTTGGSTGATGSAGPGASYTYAVSTLASSSSACAGLWAQNSGQSLSQSCITSTGTVDGVSQRVQERVVGYTAVPYFPGLLAVNGFSAAGAFTAANTVGGGPFDLGSNGQISFTNALSLSGNLEYPTVLAPNYGGQAHCTSPCVPVAEATALTVPSVPASAYTNAAASNNDAAISWPSGVTYTASTHIVSQSGVNNATVNIPAGTYFFCGMDLGGGTTATINTTSWPVKIYFGSTATGGGCATGSGGITAGNGVSIANSSGVASNVQLYFYGTPGCTTSCPSSFPANGQSYYADIYAPNSSMVVASAPTPPNVFTGDMVIGQLTANGALTFDYQVPSGAGSATTTAYYPEAHANCIPSTTTGGTAGPC
jgi:Tfp pilus assembly protein PilX